jgi:N-acetylneuraminate epimerase
LVSACLFMPVAPAQSDTLNLNWKQLPPAPDRVGLAAPFAGVSGDALILAGGANFPSKMPWEGGQKAWHDSIYVLTEPTGAWLSGFKLSRPLAYGVSVTTREGVVCAGGADAREHFREVFLLRWVGGRVESKPLPRLPRPMANGCGAWVGGTVYLAGGTEHPDATNALKVFWSLDLAAANPQWRELEPWPGPARMLAVAGVCDGDFFLFSGVELNPDPAGKPVRHYLKDAYRFTPRKGWRPICDLSRAAAAAPSPAILRQGQLLVVSGDDGKLVNFEPKSEHPGFPREVLAYDPHGDTWRELGDSPLSRACAPVVSWQGRAVIPNGEARPGYRTPEVWVLDSP